MRGTGLPVVWPAGPCSPHTLPHWLEELDVKLQPPTTSCLSQEMWPDKGQYVLPSSATWENLPVWRPLRLASFLKVTRAREWTTVGFLIIKPSRWRRAMLRRELARAISLISLGSNQILRLPHFKTSAARRFWSFKETIAKEEMFYVSIGFVISRKHAIK